MTGPKTPPDLVGNGGRFARLPTAATFDRRLSPAALRVLAGLATYADKHGKCYPSVTTLAQRLALTRRQVQRHLRTLERTGHLRTAQQKRRQGGWGVSTYYLAYSAVPTPCQESPSEPLGAVGDGGGPTAGKITIATSGLNSGNERDATSDDASATAFEHGREEIGHEPEDDHTRCDIRGCRDATSEGTFDASSDAARTSPVNYPIEQSQSARMIDQQALLSNGPAGRFGKKKASKGVGSAGLADPAQRRTRWRQKVMACMASHLRDDPAELERAFSLIVSAPEGDDAIELLNKWSLVMRSEESRPGTV